MTRPRSPTVQVSPRSQSQREYLTTIEANTVTFGIGPAGTGKTYLAVAAALQSLHDKEVKRIILTRPAVEAGERLGYLPGDLDMKMDPYMRPVYDCLQTLLGGPEGLYTLLGSGVLEVAPLAFMRGRTLTDAFVILDEAQNTTPEQMKMYLTRIGFGSKAVVNGDLTQVDLLLEETGLDVARRILKNVKGVGFTYFDGSDVVRHPVVKAIVAAYERDERR